MPDFVISEFGGLNTKKEDPANGIVLPTKVAKNTDLRSGLCKPFNVDKAIESGHTGEIIKYSGQLVSGHSDYTIMTLNGFDLMVYKDSGKWKRAVSKPSGQLRTAYTVTDLSQPTPGNPTIQQLPNDTTKVLTEPASDGWFYEMGYVITFVRDVDGYRDESAPSGIVTSQHDILAFRIRRPAVSGDKIVGWNIYRLSTGYRSTSSFQKVAEVSIGEDFYDDYSAGSELNGSFSGIFDSDGVTVLSQPAPVEFDGVCRKLYYGQMVGWKDEVLYISEPNRPEIYPAQYQIRCADKVISVETYGGDLYAFTTQGVQRIVGDNPVSMSILPDYIGYRVSNSKSSFSSEYGLYYVYKTGIGRINNNGHHSISRNLLGEHYFDDWDMSSVHMSFGDGILYIFHSKGTLLYIEERGIGFVELTNVYEGAYYDRSTGDMIGTRKNWAYSLFGGEEKIVLQYKQGGLVLNQPENKRFTRVDIFGTGKFEAKLYLDGKERSSRILNLDGMRRERMIRFPQGRLAREASWQLTGDGEITEIKAVLDG